mmetsp:Transcript_33791/g.30621  ORF Transcript_33791/g.30621 Transcript_33791/m.30621 type:complete len:165 (+) Transcript_33791:434-928(+)
MLLSKETICLQRYIKSIGPKPFIVRTCWRKDRNPYVWIITSKHDYNSNEPHVAEHHKYVTDPRVQDSCLITHSIRGRYVEETAPYVRNMVRYLEHHIPGAKFEEFIADFVKDESENWWMVNVRGFVLVDKMNIRPKEFLEPPDDYSDDEHGSKKKKDYDYQKVG